MSLTKVSYSMVTGSPANVFDYGTGSSSLTAALAQNDVVVIPAGDFLMSTQVSISANKHLIIRGTLKPDNNSVSNGTALLQITGSNVTIEFQGGGIDCISSSYNNWGGIYAAPSTATSRLSNVKVFNGLFQNIGLTSTLSAINFDGVDNAIIQNNIVTNCDGYGIYTQFCNTSVITDNIVSYVSYVGINDSAGAQNNISNNHISYSKLFGIKGGYAPNISTVTADVTPTIYTMSVSKTNSALRNIKPGTSISIFNAGGDAPIGYISAVTEFSTYLQLNFSNVLDAVPQVGVQVQLLMTASVHVGNTVNQTGDNGWDINGWSNITVVGNSLNGCGTYSAGTTYLGSGFWFGYDAQAGYNFMTCRDLLIEGNTINNTYGSAISVMSTVFDVSVVGNAIYNACKSTLSNYGGIEVTKLSYHRSGKVTISNNTINDTANYGIYSAYSTYVNISNNFVNAANGIAFHSIDGVTVSNNFIRASDIGVNTYGIQVNTGGGNPSTGVSIKNNTIQQNYGYCIRNQDASLDLVDVWNGNQMYGSAVGFDNNGNDVASIKSFLNANQCERHTTTFTTGQTITFTPIINSTANAFLLVVTSETNPTTGLQGLYLISRSTTTPNITTISNCADVTVALNGSNQITVTNATGANRTIAAAISTFL